MGKAYEAFLFLGIQTAKEQIKKKKIALLIRLKKKKRFSNRGKFVYLNHFLSFPC